LRSALTLANAHADADRRRRLYLHNGKHNRVHCHKDGLDAARESRPFAVTIAIAITNASTVVLDCYRTMIH
jgi:hypothetical protein